MIKYLIETPAELTEFSYDSIHKWLSYRNEGGISDLMVSKGILHMTNDTFQFTITRSIEDWLDASTDLLSKYRARPHLELKSLAQALRKQATLLRRMQKSCRLIRVTHRRDHSLYHYEMSGPHLTQLMLLDPEWVAHLKSTTEFLLA